LRADAGRAVCLVGLRGAGKTTVGRLVARALGRPFVDLDRLVEGRAGQLVRELFAAEGEGGFRARESEALREALALPGAVIATGGGVVLRPENRSALAGARVVYLRAGPELLAARVADDPRSADQRPALRPGGPRAEAAALLAERDPLYREVADAVVEADGAPEDVAAAVAAALAADREGD